jgi:hypothetical protein
MRNGGKNQDENENEDRQGGSGRGGPLFGKASAEQRVAVRVHGLNPWLVCAGGLGVWPLLICTKRCVQGGGLGRGRRCKSLGDKGGTFFSGCQEEGAR